MRVEHAAGSTSPAGDPRPLGVSLADPVFEVEEPGIECEVMIAR